MVRQAFVNLVTRITTAPFRLLGRLIGSGEDDLGVILFVAGDARLAPPEREKLARLGDALLLHPRELRQAKPGGDGHIPVALEAGPAQP